MASKQPTPAQLKARALFAKRAKAGEFKRKTGKATKPARKGSSGAPKATRKTVRRRNPAPAPRALRSVPVWHVHAVKDGKPVGIVATMYRQEDAVRYGRALANLYGRQYAVIQGVGAAP